jgi:Cu(I)/Ag(I) efflux system membrane fusion protein
MSAKTTAAFVLTAVLAAAAGFLAARSGAPSAVPSAVSAGRKVLFYQSPMHPWIKSDRPGKCTICGMDLVPVYEGGVGIATNSRLVTLSPATAAIIGVQTAEVRLAPLVKTLRVAGTIEDDDTRHRLVSAYVDGRIEKLFVNYIGAEVVEGQPLAVIYSPDLLAARQEFHALVHSAAGAGRDPELLSAAREKLRRLGLLDRQIDALAAAPAVTRETEILAPMSGTVIARKAYEGWYFRAGDDLFTLADFSKMWFLFDAYETDFPWVSTGQEVEVTTPSHPGKVYHAAVAFIDPNLNEASRTARVRVIIPNPLIEDSGPPHRELLHRLTGYGRVRFASPETIVAPRSAVLQTGSAPVAYVDQGGGAYEARTLTLGRTGDDTVEVLGGLRASEHVVTQGALLVDSQAQLARSVNGTDQAQAMQAAPAASAAPDISSLTPLVLAAAAAAGALARDELARYAGLVPGLQSAFATYAAAFPDAQKGPLAQFAAGLKPGPDLKAARASFEVFSTAVADLARDARLQRAGTVQIYQCPMSPVLGHGRWLQRGGEMRNPFFGSAMPDCGSAVE